VPPEAEGSAMRNSPWQVISRWVSDRGTVFVRTVPYATQGEARREFDRLTPLWWDRSGPNLLIGIRLNRESEDAELVTVEERGGATSWW
jgi:hypothetical protein